MSMLYERPRKVFFRDRDSSTNWKRSWAGFDDTEVARINKICGYTKYEVRYVS